MKTHIFHKSVIQKNYFFFFFQKQKQNETKAKKQKTDDIIKKYKLGRGNNEEKVCIEKIKKFLTDIYNH